MKAPAQERSRRTLDRLLAASVRAFANVGVDRATVAEIVGDAKSSVGSFYGRFSSKEDLVQAVDERLWGQVEARWRSSLLELAGVSPGTPSAQDGGSHWSIAVSEARTPSAIQLSRAVFDALGPDLEARTRASAYLERNGLTPASIRALARIEADILAALTSLGSSGGLNSAPGLAHFLTGVVLKTATDPMVGDDAPYHLAHVVEAALAASSAGRRLDGQAVGVADPENAVAVDAETTPAEIIEQVSQEEPPQPPSADADSTSPPRAKPEAFDIWA